MEEKNLIDYSIPITLESTEIIISQMKKSICKIYMDNGIKGTGFFCKIKYPDNEHFFKMLVTNNHLIDESHLTKDKKIEFTINNDVIQRSIIIGDRRVYINKKYETTIIEIFEEKDGIKDFMELDFDLNNEILNNKYINKSIYVLQYPNYEKVCVSYGIIKSIDLSNNYDIIHLCNTDKGSLGSPIININNNKIIGMHKGTDLNNNYNKGTLLYYPLKDFLFQKKFRLKNCVKNFISNPDTSLPCLKRLNKEIKDLLDAKGEGFQLFGFIENKIYGVLEGPPYSPYENGFFRFTITYGKDYPFKPPRFLFETKIFHSNINNGWIEIGMFRDQWSPSFNLNVIIIHVLSIISIPDFDDPLVLEIASLYKKNIEEYEKKVREYTSQYANYETIQNELKNLNFQMELNN